MASLTDEIADALARDALRAAEELGDDNLITEVSRLIGASSATTQEAFMTFVRVRLSEQRARRMLADRLGADWPLKVATPGAVAVQMAEPLPPAETSRPVPRPAAVEPPVERAPVPAPAPAPAAAPIPAYAEPAPAPAPEPTPEPDLSGPDEDASGIEVDLDHPEPTGATGIRPRLPTPTPKPAPQPVKKSFEAALMLATSLPRKPLPKPSRTYPSEPLEPGIETPDGDWG